MVPPASHKISRVSWYSGSPPECLSLALQDSHLLWLCFPAPSGPRSIRVVGPTTPADQTIRWFGLLPFRSPLLRESRLISSRRATEMFQFTRCPPSLPMCSAGGLQTSLWRGCPIRILRAHGLYAAPLNVSPVSASFFGQERQGIHLVLCVACSSFVCLLFPAPPAHWLRSMERKFLCFSLALRQN